MFAMAFRRLILMLLTGLILFHQCSYGLRFWFGSKTPYDDALLQQHNSSSSKPGDTLNQKNQCIPKALFMVARHGSRWPTGKHIRKFEKLQKHVLSHLNWSHAFNLENEGLLTSKGEAEMRALGARTRRTFRQLFEKHVEYHPKRYEFKSSQALRSLQSAHAFAMGMFGTAKSFAIQSDTMDRDYLLRFHDNCPSYVKNKKALTPKLEHLLDEVVHRVRQRVHATAAFDHKALVALWGACLFEATALDKLDGACSYFTKEDAEVLEYANDVEDYWEKSHGQQINHQMSCVLIADMLASLDALKVRFLFGHAETIMPVAAFLGFFRDAEHLGRNFTEESRARKWRSGVVSPFGANIAFVLWKCDDDANNSSNDYIEILHNERPMDLSHLCPQVSAPLVANNNPRITLCRFSDFKAALKDRIDLCDFQEICKLAEDLKKAPLRLKEEL